MTLLGEWGWVPSLSPDRPLTPTPGRYHRPPVQTTPRHPTSTTRPSVGDPPSTTSPPSSRKIYRRASLRSRRRTSHTGNREGLSEDRRDDILVSGFLGVWIIVTVDPCRVRVVTGRLGDRSRVLRGDGRPSDFLVPGMDPSHLGSPDVGRLLSRDGSDTDTDTDTSVDPDSTFSEGPDTNTPSVVYSVPLVPQTGSDVITR